MCMEMVVSQIVEKITELLENRDRILIAIDGSCTSGKSTLAAALSARYDCNLFHMDDFFLRPHQRTPDRLAQPGGNVDYERFLEEVLLPLGRGEAFSYRPYDCTTGTLRAPVAVKPKPISIIEGSYSHHPYFGDPYDLKIFLRITPEVRLQRILRRPAFLQQRFFTEWIPMEQQYFREFAIEEKADLSLLPPDNQ